ncbi:MAG: hypothetical protein JST75_15950 [Bacteroidetes bacterium]|nr:hypothetical protein [Bacteroidota bacterium]
MKNFFFWLTRVLGMSLVVFQLYRYIFSDVADWENFKGKSIFYDLSYLVGFNLFLLAGILLIFISNKIRKRNYSARQ